MTLADIADTLEKDPCLSRVIDGGLLGVCPFSLLEDSLLNCRAKNRLPRNAASVLVALFPYRTPLEPGNLSRYAVAPDYHQVAGDALKVLCGLLQGLSPSCRFEPFCDNSPIPEVRAAASCGLGVRGENGLLIHPRYGSWVFIGTVVTDCLISPTGQGTVQPCLRCGRCRTECPGKALSEKGLARETCLSHITQKRGSLSPQEQALVIKGGLAWGCDACQECCPMNAGTENTRIERFLAGAQANAIAGAAGPGSDRAYGWRGPAVLKRNLALLRKEEEIVK